MLNTSGSLEAGLGLLISNCWNDYLIRNVENKISFSFQTKQLRLYRRQWIAVLGVKPLHKRIVSINLQDIFKGKLRQNYVLSRACQQKTLSLCLVHTAWGQPPPKKMSLPVIKERPHAAEVSRAAAWRRKPRKKWLFFSKFLRKHFLGNDEVEDINRTRVEEKRKTNFLYKTTLKKKKKESLRMKNRQTKI